MQHRTPAALAACIVVAPAAHAGIVDTLEFEDLTAGDTFATGTPFITEGITVTTNEFFFGGGGSTTSGFAEVINPNLAGAGNGIFANNTNLDFGFVFPQSTVGFSYTNQGGNVNLTINGSLLNANQLFTLDGTMVGDVLVSVAPTSAGLDFGAVTLEGTITQFSIGGQEFTVDDVRYTVPTPGALALCGITALTARRRR
ncbi:MAG: hypothetical protein AAGH64_05970 [Planctomycetota bacterium]